jgi:6-phospho-beta-glucosidase
MDIDQERLALIRMTNSSQLNQDRKFEIDWTTDVHKAISGSDFIVTTFREGSLESRVIDEQVPLKYGVLGQETTGPGGFAMALRTIPAILKYVNLIEELAPDAWLLNFTNPAGIITETITRVAGFEHSVGICDNPPAMVRAAAALLGVDADDFFPEYYGINHLGWMRALYLNGKDMVPEIIRSIKETDAFLEHFPFDIEAVEKLGRIPNEYNYFYSAPRKTVGNLLKAGQSRAQQILPFNQELYASLRRIRDEGEDPQKIQSVYLRYLAQRQGTYMTLETGRKTIIEPAEAIQEKSDTKEAMDQSAEGYSAVALGVIEALTVKPKVMILNVPNRSALPGMAADDVVETTCMVGSGVVRPFAMGELPKEDLGLIQSVKAYERLTIEAAVENSYDKALEALWLHPLVPGYDIARNILDDYLDQHGDYFPKLR